jgi:cellulose synthase/poly-beta-1,6-N-acetylglucosamine synthase-like glycosyltransferase
MPVLQPSSPKNAELLEHLLTDNTTPGDVELSIVIPAMNEEITVGEFMEWCKEGLQRAGVSGQILIVDSSTDNTPKIVLEHGGGFCALQNAALAARTWMPFLTSAENGS